MGVALTLKQYLEDHEINYDLVIHEKTQCSSDTAQVCHVSGNDLAKGVVLKRKKGYLLAVLPASQNVRLGKMGRWLKQPVRLATEDEVSELFDDCEQGAVPPIGAAYGLKAIIDEQLEGHDDIYFEAGDHVTLIHIPGRQFDRLMKKVPHESIGKELSNEETPLDLSEYNFWGT